MVSNGEMTSLISSETSQKVMMKTVTKNTYFEVNAEYARKLQKANSDLPFLPERMNIDKYQKLVCNLHDKKIGHAHKSPKAAIKPLTNNSTST